MTKWYIVAHKRSPDYGYKAVRDECYVNPWEEVVDTAETDEEAGTKLRDMYAVRDVMDT